MNHALTSETSCSPTRRFVVTTLLVTLLGLLLRTLLLSSQPASLDDFGVGLTAINYIESGQLGPIMWNHPDLSYILVYCALKLFGPGVIGLKVLSVVFGALSVTFVALVARRITRDETIALLAAFLWAIDSLSIDMSRQAVHEIYQSFFPLVGVYLAYRFRESGRSLWLVGSGVVFGLGIATKWNGAFPLAVTCCWLGVIILSDRELLLGERYARSALVAAALLVIPVVIYVMTFIPWLGRGYSLTEWVGLQQSMYRETSIHTGYKGTIKGDSNPAVWFVLPVSWDDLFDNRDSMDSRADDPSGQETVTVLMGLTNPLVWLLVIPAIVLAVRRGFRGRDEGLCFLTALFLGTYLPLLIVALSRPVWVCTALSVMPFGVIAVAYLICTWLTPVTTRKNYFIVYLVLVVLVAVPLYFLATGKGLSMPIAGDYLRQRIETKGY